MSMLASIGRRRTRVRAAGLVTAAAVVVTLGLGAATSQAAPADKPATTPVDIFAINDFHGNLLPPGGSSGLIAGTPAGGAEYLATHLRQLRADATARGEQSITVAAGDLIGASPLLSAAFHDEPTIEEMNTLGLELTSVGNHEFDEGWHELLRMQNGGCINDGDGLNNQNSCPDPAQPSQARTSATCRRTCSGPTTTTRCSSRTRSGPSRATRWRSSA